VILQIKGGDELVHVPSRAQPYDDASVCIRLTTTLPLQRRPIAYLLLVALMMVVSAMLITRFFAAGGPTPLAPSRMPFIASVDTMKESMDTDSQVSQLSGSEIAADVDLTSRLDTTHIAVDTYWDYPIYLGRWVTAVRATHKHVWFRLHPNRWEGADGTSASLSPADYLRFERAFILAHPTLFRSGDILDICPEPENSPYWRKAYGANWTSSRVAVDAYNRFILDTTDVARRALRERDIYGVVTTIRSVTAWFALHPAILYPSTVTRLGAVTVDSYPDGPFVDPTRAARARITELAAIERIRRVPMVLGEMGYSARILVDDTTQQSVLAAEFAALRRLSYLRGVNYWVGAGSAQYDGTRLFTGTRGAWSLRPAGHVLAVFFSDERQPYADHF